ncbi:MAG: HAD family hydrolase, partial [Oceanipulchritudo sp.]
LSRNKAPRDVFIVPDELEGGERQPLERLKPGQRMRILPGEAVPVLAELESQQASLSFEWINGESAMRRMTRGQYVPSGAQNIGLEPILATARQPWREALLARLLASHPTEQRNHLMERVLRIYIGLVLLIALAGGTVWALGLGAPLTGLQVALSVLVVSCPCALGVAFPLAQEWAVLHLRPHGIFVRSGTLFGKLGQVRRIVMDKTGTLTLEAPELATPESLERLEPEDETVLREMVRSSLHPVSRALREAFLQRENPAASPPEGLSIREEVGYGLMAASAGGTTEWSLGRPGWKSRRPAVSESPRSECEFRRNGHLLASFAFREALRDDAMEAVERLGHRFPMVILSGDRNSKVRRMAERLGLHESAALGEQTPEAKEAFVKSLGAREALYLGDGANDALAFSQAAVRGTPATPHGLLQDKADFFFTGRSLGGLLHLFRIRDLRQRAVRAAFSFAVANNIIVVAIALAAHMHPLLAAILMPLSSLATLGLVALIYRRGQRKLQA